MKIPPSKLKFIPSRGTYPLGFLASAASSGVKKESMKDIAIIVSPEHKCKAAAVFTTNKFCAAPVQVSKTLLNESLFGVVVNSGCANACTGEQGLADAQEMSKIIGNLPSLVMSTGVIGQKLQMSKIRSGLRSALENAGSDHHSWMAAAEGIMTTDTFPKLKSQDFRTYRMAGWSKGAGMSTSILISSSSQYGNYAFFSLYGCQNFKGIAKRCC
jgi:glutamate N-acetyltransferase/amino-acid N-acetyltransferase